MSHTVRFWLVAFGVGLGAALASLSTDATWDGAAIRGAVALGLAAVVQYITPISDVGLRSNR